MDKNRKKGSRAVYPKVVMRKKDKRYRKWTKTEEGKGE